MFDIGFGELFLIAVVALLVLGPERLPKAARFTGLWVRKARAQWYSVKSEFERDMAADELQRSLRETRESLRQAEEQLRSGVASIQTQLEQGFDDNAAAMPPAPPPGEATQPVQPSLLGDDHAFDQLHADAHHADSRHHDDDERPLGSTLEGLYEPPPPSDADDDEAAPPPRSDDAHAGR